MTSVPSENTLLVWIALYNNTSTETSIRTMNYTAISTNYTSIMKYTSTPVNEIDLGLYLDTANTSRRPKSTSDKFETTLHSDKQTMKITATTSQLQTLVRKYCCCSCCAGNNQCNSCTSSDIATTLNCAEQNIFSLRNIDISVTKAFETNTNDNLSNIIIHKRLATEIDESSNYKAVNNAVSTAYLESVLGKTTTVAKTTTSKRSHTRDIRVIYNETGRHTTETYVQAESTYNDFNKIKEEIMTVAAELTNDEKAAIFFSLQDVVVDCQFAGTSCALERDFTTFYSLTLGNCFSFNSGLNKTQLYVSRRAGLRYGIKLAIQLYKEFTCW